MDIATLLKKVNNINEYVAVTENASAKCKTSKIQLNMSNVLALTKIRSLEIEHINKCEQNGIACVIFERMLSLPPSKTWEVLSKEMVNVLQYWLDAVRKHLMKHSAYWWTFLKLLLQFIREIHNKGNTISNILVEHISECLLDLATAEHPDALQRYEILHCFNLFCCESSREIRLALRSKFEQYFTKLSAYMCNCGHLPTQYSILETLLRWLVPRQDRTLRVTTATKWFPTKMYTDNTVDIFLERSWMDFYQDARDFLNTHNVKNDVITSVICTKLSVSDVVIISDKHYKDSWLDVNYNTKCISVLLNPRVLDAFGGTTSYKSFETLMVTGDNIQTAKFYRQNELLILSIQTITAPSIVPSLVKLGNDLCDVTAIVTSHCDHKRLDAALRNILEDKYQLLIDLEELTLPPISAKEPSNINVSEAQTSLPRVKARPSQRTGIKLRHPIQFKSPSSASTTSLAQLHERLAELPRLTFVREPQVVSANPALSAVTEVSETDDRSTSTFKNKRFGTCVIKRSNLNKRKCQSDNEIVRRNSDFNETVGDKEISPSNDHSATSSLLIATIGSADEAVIYNKKESISKSQFFNGDNIIDILMQEASSAQLQNDIVTGINAKEKRAQFLDEKSEAIENTPNAEVNRDIVKVFKRRSGFKVISSTSDESNTEFISDTPNVYVSTRRKNKNIPTNQSQKILDDKIVDDFFSQHVNKGFRETISPTLARKLNETSSDNSTGVLDDNLILMAGGDLQDGELVDFEVLECLNNILDKVCNDLDKCTKYMCNENNLVAHSDSDFEDNIPLQDVLNLNLTAKNTQNRKKKITSQNTKSKYKNKTKSRVLKDKNKAKLENKSKMSTILEDNAEAVEENMNLLERSEQNITVADNNLNPESTANTITPLMRKKRKLFSPKDEDTDKVVPLDLQPKDMDTRDTQINKPPISASIYTPHREIEMKSQKNIRILRNIRKSRTIDITSPRSKKRNELFDKIKNSSNCEQVVLADKTNKFEVYNFSSDSEDNFRVQKMKAPKKNSVSSLDNNSMVLRKGKTIKRRNSSSKNNSNNKSKIKKEQKGINKKNIEVDHELIDERIRQATDVLNTSIVVDHHTVTITEPDPVIEKAAEIEVIYENNSDLKDRQQKIKVSKKNKKKNVELIKGVKTPLNKSNIDDERTVSPLPGLVVEKVATKSKDHDLSAKMAEKFKHFFQNSEKYINESNTTQNLLSDNERNVCSPQNLEIIDEVAEIHNDVQNKSETKSFRAKKIKLSKEETSRKKSMIQTKDKSRSKSKSEYSIATASITGHGNSDEAPPNSELITQRLEHRNLDTDYLDDSMKEYCNKLRNEINGMIINSNKSNKSKSLSNNSSTSFKSSKSPVLSIKRLSPEDIRRWLPSSRASESSIQSETSRNSKRNVKVDKEVNTKTTPPSHAKDSNSQEDVHIPIKRSLRLLEKSLVKSQSKSVLEPDASKSNSPSLKKTIKKKTRIQPSRSVKCTPRSVISPIKLFEEISETPLSEDEDFMEVIRETSRNIQKTRTENLNSEINTFKQNKEDLVDAITENQPTSSKDSESIRSKISSSVKIPNSTTVIELEQEMSSAKKRKIEKTASGSVGTLSSIDDWFKRNATSDSTSIVKDSIMHVLEKVDTTLAEIQQDTSEKLGKLYMSTHQRWSEIKEEKQRVYKTVAFDILTEVVKIVDKKFQDLAKKSEEQDREFLNHLKQQSLTLVKEDCLKKRVMVQLLKEDLEAVLKNQGRKRKAN